MMKQEFEKLVGKEVAPEVFEIYEAMYMATPESVSKRAFVAMLNIDAIPESDEAKARKEERAKFIAEMQDEINALKTEINEARRNKASEEERYYFWKNEGDAEMVKFCKSSVDFYKREIKQKNAKIAELKFIIG